MQRSMLVTCKTKSQKALRLLWLLQLQLDWWLATSFCSRLCALITAYNLALHPKQRQVLLNEENYFITSEDSGVKQATHLS